MNVIYTHISPNGLPFSSELTHSNYTFVKIPEYAKYSIEQSRKLLNTDPIIISNEYVHELIKEESIEFFNLCKTGFPSFYKDPFWFTTLFRLYVLSLYCKNNNINEFIHLEYDNLIYSDLSELKPLPPSVYFTRVGPYCSSAGFVYCNSLAHLIKFIDKIKQLISKGENFARQFTRYDHLSEMIMIDLIHEHTTNVINYLPILPNGVGSDNFDKLNVLFDGASYGQFLGGTNNGHGKGWHEQHHYIGQQIGANNIQVIFESKPFVIFNNKKIPILNLHIHSKNLKDFIC